jgi:hypothetical protein
MKEIIEELEQAKLFIENIATRGYPAYLDRENALACINRAISHLNVPPIEKSDKCSHIPGKTADDCPECIFMKPGPLEGSGICKYPIKQEESMVGIERIAAEMKRQIEDEKWTEKHDDQWNENELAMAALRYVLPDSHRFGYLIDQYWLWDVNRYKPTPNNRIRELEKAGALMAAEIDRLLIQESKS